MIGSPLPRAVTTALAAKHAHYPLTVGVLTVGVAAHGGSVQSSPTMPLERCRALSVMTVARSGGRPEAGGLAYVA